MSFVQAAQATPMSSRTYNDMKTLQSSTDPIVDLFFLIGASRNKNITPEFEKAFQHDREKALRILLWARDIREGAGERQTFKLILKHIAQFHPDEIEHLIPYIPEFGRWDDLLVLVELDSPIREFTIKTIINAIINKRDALCAKWMPRQGKLAKTLQEYANMSPKTWRKTLVELTKVVETLMCANKWNEIEFGKLPSIASARYQKAFGRHAHEQYTQYIEALKKGEDKINASAIYPYQVIQSIKSGNYDVAKAQWEALPNYTQNALLLPMVDVSGSMAGVSLGKSTTALDVAVSLGLYLSDKNKGPFKDAFLTFSGNSTLQILKGDIIAKCNQLQKAEWGMNTNLHRALETVLHIATYNKLPGEDMPQYILILSDMEFDSCINFDDTAFEMINRKFKAANYNMPNIIFWNLRGRSGNCPVSFKENGTALVSGFSPSILRSILKAELITPLDIMLQTIMVERYDVVVKK